jgi:hypothetical protein
VDPVQFPGFEYLRFFRRSRKCLLEVSRGDDLSLFHSVIKYQNIDGLVFVFVFVRLFCLKVLRYTFQ